MSGPDARRRRDGPPRRSGRLPGPDVVRAVALIGVVVMNFHGYLILRGGRSAATAPSSDFFDPWTGPLSTRFAATFVLVAGVGVTLLTRRVDRRPAAGRGQAAGRWSAAGSCCTSSACCSTRSGRARSCRTTARCSCSPPALFTLRSRWVLAVGARRRAGRRRASHWWRLERRLDGDDVDWLARPPAAVAAALLFDVFVNGTHPLLPWLAFFCAGIVLGRLLRTDVVAAGWRSAAGSRCSALATLDLGRRSTRRTAGRRRWRAPTRSTAGCSTRRARSAPRSSPSASISWLAERFVAHGADRAAAPRRGDEPDALRRPRARVQPARRLARLGRPDRPRHGARRSPPCTGSSPSPSPRWWHRRFGIGPVEWVYRRLGG